MLSLGLPSIHHSSVALLSRQKNGMIPILIYSRHTLSYIGWRGRIYGWRLIKALDSEELNFNNSLSNFGNLDRKAHLCGTSWPSGHLSGIWPLQPFSMLCGLLGLAAGASGGRREAPYFASLHEWTIVILLIKSHAIWNMRIFSSSTHFKGHFFALFQYSWLLADPWLFCIWVLETLKILVSCLLFHIYGRDLVFFDQKIG